MSPLERQLTVRAGDPTAEITVYDASFNRVGRGVGQYSGRHADGLYEIRVRTAGTQEEKLISLDRDQTVEVAPVSFASPVPLVQTATTDEAHQAAVVRACNQPVPLGAGSGLLIVVRDRSGREAAPQQGSPAAGLSVIGPGGMSLYDVGRYAPVDSSGRSPVATVMLHVNPGVYRLRLDYPDGPDRERTLVASPNWATQCFMVRRRRREQYVADLDQRSLSLSTLSKPFAPDDRLT